MADENTPPFAPPLFRASEVKIARAAKHIRELAEAIATHLAANPGPYIVPHSPEPSEPSDTPGQRRLRFKFDFIFPGVPDEFGAIIGDAIHNMRSALDLMACDLVRANEKSPANVYFPFSEVAEDFDQMVKSRHFDRAGEKAVALLKSYEPYRGGNVALRAIHDLDVDDKHKFLLPTFQSAAAPPFQLVEVDGDQQIAFLDAEPSPLLVVFPLDSVFAGEEIVPTLHRLVELTASVVEAFKALTL